MADRSNQLILGALSQALAQGEALPLHGSRSTPGLFPTSAAGKTAALRCQQEGWLAPDADGCLITEKGIRYLLAQLDPRRVLEDLVRALETRQDEVTQLVEAARRMQASLEGLRANAERVLAHIETPPSVDEVEHQLPANLGRLFRQFQANGAEPTGAADLGAAIVEALAAWPAGASEDCPLPDLFRQVVAKIPSTTLGGFHDALRELCSADRIALHPWPGPLYEIPEPSCALLCGHMVAYYASVRS